MIQRYLLNSLSLSLSTLFAPVLGVLNLLLIRPLFPKQLCIVWVTVVLVFMNVCMQAHTHFVSHFYHFQSFLDLRLCHLITVAQTHLHTSMEHEFIYDLFPLECLHLNVWRETRFLVGSLGLRLVFLYSFQL